MQRIRGIGVKVDACWIATKICFAEVEVFIQTLLRVLYLRLFETQTAHRRQVGICKMVEGN